MQFELASPLLVLEASTGIASVALFIDGALTADKSIAMGPANVDAMMPSIATILKEATIRGRDVRTVACGSGPGSFTSLRIAASIAKGFAANGAMLFAVPSLLLAAAKLIDQPGRYVLHSDALRGDRYTLSLQIDVAGKILSDGVAVRMSAADVYNTAHAHGSVAVAVGETTFSDVDAFALIPEARNVTALASLWDSFGPVVADSWQPSYGRLAEAQVKWETAHGHELPTG